MISLRSECLLVALGSQPQLSLPVTGKEAGTGMEQALTQPLSPSLESSVACLSESQAPPDLIWRKDMSPDASALRHRGNGARL